MDDSNQRHKDATQSLKAGVDGILKFLHLYDPQNENDKNAKAFMDFLVSHSTILASGGDDIVRDLYHKFKEQSDNPL